MIRAYHFESPHHFMNIIRIINKLPVKVNAFSQLARISLKDLYAPKETSSLSLENKSVFLHLKEQFYKAIRRLGMKGRGERMLGTQMNADFQDSIKG